MIVKIATALVGVLLVGWGLGLAASEANIWAEYEAYSRVMGARARIPDAEVNAAAALVSRWEDRPAPAVAKRELEILDRIVAQSNGRPSQALEQRIAATARKLARGSPASGRAWCALSESGMRLRTDPASMNRSLMRCHETAPFEMDFMSRRLLQSVVMWPLLSPDLREAAIGDLERLLNSPGQGLQMGERAGRLVATIAPERAAEFERVVAKADVKVQAVYQQTIDYQLKQANVKLPQ